MPTRQIYYFDAKKQLMCFVVFMSLFFLAPGSVLGSQGDSLRSRKDVDRPVGFFDAIEPVFGYGFLMSHHPSMRHLVKDQFTSYQLNISGTTSGKQHWHHLYRFPSLGVSFYYANLAYPDVLGEVYAIMPSISLKHKIAKGFEIVNRNSLGMGYLTKWYHPTENYRNNAIGRGLNIALSLNIEAAWNIYGPLTLKGGLSLTHFSSGAKAVPNKGLNIPAVNAGLVWMFRKKEASNEVVGHGTIAENRSQTYIIPSFGFKRIFPVGGPLYPEYGIQIAHVFSMNEKIRLGPAVDLFYSSSDKVVLENRDDKQYSFGQLAKLGAGISYEQVYNRLTFVVQAGYYLKTERTDVIPMYNRAGFRYQLTDHLLLNYSLKTHLFKADYVEYGLGWKF